MLLKLGLLLFTASELALSTRVQPNHSSSEVDAVLEELLGARWGPDEDCRTAMVDLVRGVKNQTLGATWVWDANARPSGVFYGSQYQLGGYSQCLQAPWPPRTKYCLADIRLSLENEMKRTSDFQPEDNVSEYFGYKTRCGRSMNVVTWGVCTPEACSESGVTRLLPLMLRQSHLRLVDVINVDSCQVSGEKHLYDTSFWVFVGTFTILWIAAIMATLFNKSSKSNSMLSTIINSFCMERNWLELKKVNKDEIKILNGVRVICSVIFVGVHYIYIANSTAILNYMDYEKFLSTKVGTSLTHSDIGIDTFFTISGLLLAKGLIYSKQINILKILARRYFRLIGVFAISMWAVASVLPHSGAGPLWGRFGGQEFQYCKDNWWLGLFMIGNYVNCERYCYLVSWYIQCDFQLTVLGVVLYWLYMRNRRVGALCFATVAVLGFLMPALITYWEQLSPIYFHSIDKASHLRSNAVLTSVYIKAHNRSSAYFIGMAMGYILTVFKPDENKKMISKEFSLITVLGSLYVMQEVMKAGGNFFGEQYTGVDSLVFVSLNRCVWALAICAFIMAFEYGTVPIVGGFLRSDLAVLCSRLSYAVYLVHMLFVYRIVNAIQAPITFDYVALLAVAIGVLALTLFTSLILWFTVEAPLNNICHLLFRSKKVSGRPVDDQLVGEQRQDVQKHSTS